MGGRVRGVGKRMKGGEVWVGGEGVWVGRGGCGWESCSHTSSCDTQPHGLVSGLA